MKIEKIPSCRKLWPGPCSLVHIDINAGRPVTPPGNLGWLNVAFLGGIIGARDRVTERKLGASEDEKKEYTENVLTHSSQSTTNMLKNCVRVLSTGSVWNSVAAEDEITRTRRRESQSRGENISRNNWTVGWLGWVRSLSERLTSLFSKTEQFTLIDFNTAAKFTYIL